MEVPLYVIGGVLLVTAIFGWSAFKFWDSGKKKDSG